MFTLVFLFYEDAVELPSVVLMFSGKRSVSFQHRLYVVLRVLSVTLKCRGFLLPLSGGDLPSDRAAVFLFPLLR